MSDDDLIYRLRAEASDTEDWTGRAMTTWDQIRGQVQSLPGSDLPRLNFESLLENYAALMREAADRIDVLTPSRAGEIEMADVPRETLKRLEKLLCVVGGFSTIDRKDHEAIGCQLWASEIKEARALQNDISEFLSSQ